MSGVNSDSLLAIRYGEDSTYDPSLQEHRVELCSTMRGRIYVIDCQQLMDHFFPPPIKKSKHAPKKTIPDLFSDAPQFATESAMYQWITSRLNESKLFEGYTFVATPYKSDPNDPSKQAIDGGMYRKKHAPEDARTANGEQSRRMNWSRIELAMECKVHSTNKDPIDESRSDYEATAVERREVFGQLLSYAELVFKYQQRTFHFTVLFFSDSARIFRFDRSGIVATHKLMYATDGAKLTEFLVRYARLGATNRGHDSTSERIDSGTDLYATVKAHAHKAMASDPNNHAAQKFYSALTASWPLWKIQVHDEFTEEPRLFVVGRPQFEACGVAGRGTRGYIGLPLNHAAEPNGPYVYLKDAWRVVHPTFEKEGNVLKTLNEQHVQYVPTLVCHGDVPSQDAMSYVKWSACFPDAPQDQCPLKHHRHYRLVVAEVGRPLEEFENGMQFLTVIWCCIVAHEQACKAGYIHRDISAGNILLYQTKDGTVGLLNDWELAQAFPNPEDQGISKQLDRTGTWQYMSAHALLNHAKVITIADDLESFLHVIVQFSVRFLPHNCADDAVGNFLYSYFDDYSDGLEGETCGPAKYYAMITGQIYLTLVISGKNISTDRSAQTLELYAPSQPGQPVKMHPLHSVIQTLLSWFKAFYARDFEQDKPSVSTGVDDTHSNYATMPSIIAKAMEADSKPLPELHSYPVQQKGTADPAASLVVSHAPMKRYIMRQLAELKWPVNDKGEDKRPKKIINPQYRESNGAAEFIANSKKRRSQNVVISTSKRTKTDC